MNNQLGERVAAVLALACILAAPYIHPPWAFALAVILLALVLLFVEKTTFFSVSIIALAIFYGIGIFPLFIFSCTLAFVVIGELAFRSAGENLYAYFAYIIVAAVSALLITLYLNETAPLLPVLFGLIAAVLLKAILGDRDDALMVETLGISMTMLLINDLDYQVSISHLSLAIVIAFAFGYFSY